MKKTKEMNNKKTTKKGLKPTSHITHPTSQKGITLIALVITIIVMLILVGVTISMAVNGGLFDYAGKAVGDTNNAIKAEQQLSNGGITIGNTYYNSIDEYLGSTGGTQNNTEETLVALYKAGTLKVGDYVDYNPAGLAAVNPDNPENADGVAVGTLTGYTTAAQNIAYEDLSWRVLGYDETNDKLLLISATPTTGALNFYGYVGYNNYEGVLETVCSKLYSNTSIGATARSITMEDIDTYLGGSAFTKETYGGGSETSGGYGYRNQNVSSKFQVDESGNLELVENEGRVTLDLTSNAYNYIANSVITDSTKLDLLQGGSMYYYWIISRGVTVHATGSVWGVGAVAGGRVIASYSVCYNAANDTGAPLCIRPVVSLSSTVTTEDVPVLETAPTLNWNDPLGMYQQQN